MDYVFLFCDHRHEYIATLMLQSLYKCCATCTVIFYGCSVNNRRLIDSYSGRIEYYPVEPEEFNDRIATCKIEKLAQHPFDDYDRVICFDLDMLIQNNPFTMFDIPGDMYVTTRHYPCKYVCNGGTFGFVINDNSRKMIQFYNEQVHLKDWTPYKQFLLGYRHYNCVNWSVGQDFLCVAWEQRNSLPFECRIVDAGYHYNYCPDYGDANDRPHYRRVINDLFSKIGNKEYKVLHYKGESKKEMPYHYARLEKIYNENKQEAL